MFATRVSSDLANPFIRRSECRIDGDFVALDMFQSKSGSGFGTSIFLSSASNFCPFQTTGFNFHGLSSRCFKPRIIVVFRQKDRCRS